MVGSRIRVGISLVVPAFLLAVVGRGYGGESIAVSGGLRRVLVAEASMDSSAGTEWTWTAGPAAESLPGRGLRLRLACLDCRPTGIVRGVSTRAAAPEDGQPDQQQRRCPKRSLCVHVPAFR